ncbi:hypothetical protein ACOMHN_004302 [Nucella lapillus]
MLYNPTPQLYNQTMCFRDVSMDCRRPKQPSQDLVTTTMMMNLARNTTIPPRGLMGRTRPADRSFPIGRRPCPLPTGYFSSLRLPLPVFTFLC